AVRKSVLEDRFYFVIGLPQGETGRKYQPRKKRESCEAPTMLHHFLLRGWRSANRNSARKKNGVRLLLASRLRIMTHFAGSAVPAGAGQTGRKKIARSPDRPGNQNAGSSTCR